MSHASNPAPTAEPAAAAATVATSGAAPGAAFRYVHCADVHLDSPFRCASDDVRARLHAAGRAAFVRLVDLCLAERVHALLIAGDLFDDERLTFVTEDFLVAQLSRLTQAGIHVVAVSGNHDHGGDDGRAARIAWPQERFTLIRGHLPEEVVITAADGRTLARVIGCGHVHGNDGENLAALFPKAGDAAAKGAPVVGLLHARLAEADGAEHHPPVAPCTLADLSAAGYRTWALGHVHRRQELRGAASGDGVLAAYAGALIGHQFGESGAHGALVVTVPQRGAVTTEFRELAGVRWETLTLDSLPQIHDLAALRAAATEAFLRLRSTASETRDTAADPAEPGADPADPGAGAAARAAAPMHWMLRLSLSGACPAAAELQHEDFVDELSEQLTAELGPEHGVLSVQVIEDGVHRPVELAAHRDQPHVLGLSLSVLDALAADDAVLDGVSPAVLAGCPDKHAAAKRDYLRSLLTGLDSAAGESLLKETNA